MVRFYCDCCEKESDDPLIGIKIEHGYGFNRDICKDCFTKVLRFMEELSKPKKASKK